MKTLLKKLGSSIAYCVVTLSLCFSTLLMAASPLDINIGTADQFAAIMSGVGQKKAEAIVAYREANGPFTSVDQLVEVKGIGHALLQRNRALVQVSEATEETQ